MVFRVQELSQQLNLPPPLKVLVNPPTKFAYKALVRKRVADVWHQKLVESSSQKSSLKFFRPQFLPLLKGPHPVLLSCGNSISSVRAATIVVRILSGRYRDDKLLSRFNNSSGACSLPSCSSLCGDSLHLLSGECSALRDALLTTLNNCLHFLSISHPILIPPVIDALHRGPLEFVRLILDPSSDVNVIRISQEYGQTFIWPLFRVGRAYVWTMHKNRMKLINQV